MNIVLTFTEPAIYGVMMIAGVYGVFLVILVIRAVRRKKFPNLKASDAFLEEVRERLQQRDFDGVQEICDSPRYWTRASAQLVQLAMTNRERGPVKVRQLLAEKFERDVLAELRRRHAWVATITRAAPMLGLLGTVTSMVLAFASIGESSQKGLDPGKLAGDLSLALQATMLGLWIAVPMTLLGSMLLVRIGKLTDSVQEEMGVFLYDLEQVMRK